MKKSATIALVSLLLLSLGLSAYLVMDQMKKKKLISTQGKDLAKHLTDIKNLKTQHTDLDSQLKAANEATADAEKEHTKLKSVNELLQVKIKSRDEELLAKAKAPNEEALKLQEDLDALKEISDEAATELAAMEARNKSLEEQVTNHQNQHRENTNALAEAQATLKPFLELNRTPDEITKGLMKRPVNISKPLPPRPAAQAGKITEPIPNPVPNPVPTNQP